MPNSDENSFPQAANPDAVYGIKNTIITTAAIAERIFLLS